MLSNGGDGLRVYYVGTRMYERNVLHIIGSILP